jgi:hypothetical protein
MRCITFQKNVGRERSYRPSPSEGDRVAKLAPTAPRPIAAAEKREQPRMRERKQIWSVMRPIDENRDDALIFTGIGSLFTAIAAVLLRLPGVRHHFRIFQRVRGRRSIAKRVGTSEIRHLWPAVCAFKRTVLARSASPSAL